LGCNGHFVEVRAKTLDTFQLSTYVPNTMPQNDPDRRRGHRIAFTMPAPVSTGTGNDDLIEDSSTIDISDSGVRLRLRGHIEPGQIVYVHLNKHPEQCRVVWTNSVVGSDQLIAGLEFTSPMPDI